MFVFINDQKAVDVFDTHFLDTFQHRHIGVGDLRRAYHNIFGLDQFGAAPNALRTYKLADKTVGGVLQDIFRGIILQYIAGM